MSRDVLNVGSTMRIPLLYRGEYSQWVERFMNYLEEQTDGEAMINSIKNGDQPLPRVTQVSIAGTTSTEQPPLKAKSMCNKTEKDLWDALARHMLGSEYGEQDRKAAVLYEIVAIQKIINKKLIDINIDALYNILKKNQGDVNDVMGSKKKTVVVTSDPLALIAEKTNVSRSKEKVVVSLDSEGSEADDFSELKKITALLAKVFNQRQFYSKPTNNNLRTSSSSQSANKKQEFVKTDDKKVEKKADEKKRDMSIVKCYNCKKEGHFAKDCKKAKVKDYEYYKTKMLLTKKDKDEQVLLAEDQAWMESSSDLDHEINANMVFMAQIEKVLSDSEASSSSADEKISKVSYYLLECECESEYETSEYYDNSTNYGLFVNNDDDQEIFHDAIEYASENFIENHINSQKDYDKSDADHNDSEEKEYLEKYAKLEAERYEYMIRYSAYFDNDKQHRKQIADQQVLFDKMSVQLVELDKHVRDLENTVLEKDFKIYELEECVIGLGYTLMFLTHSDEALEIKKFKRSRENKIEFAYDYGNLNASYVNEKINFDYFQEIINLDFKKIDSPFQQTSSLKPYVPNVILKKIIIDLEDEVVSLLEKEKANLETIESLKSKGFESSEKVCSESKNESENDCLVVEKECDKEENPNKGSSNTSNVGLSAVSVLNLNKNVKRYSRKDLLACNNSHLGETRSDFVCNDCMNVSCDFRMNDLLDDNNFFIFDDVNVRISAVSKMPFRKKPCDSMHVRSKSNSNKSLPRTVHKWLPKLQPLAKPVAKLFPELSVE
uniref:Ribonuclease H-like domain-containing protein n=1 Tax=Tanacetum cinerariifolium TaxID=118510 RepID=A0A699IN01_TANCI|nr:ribonuclease H-like domain-containing protein [Tanacetum cinerariifolium]